MADTCLHCGDGHTRPTGRYWGVYVAPARDGDGQPTTLHVAPSDGAHVAESDAEWLRALIDGDQTSASQIVDEILAPLKARVGRAEHEWQAATRRAERAEATVTRLYSAAMRDQGIADRMIDHPADGEQTGPATPEGTEETP
jgi:hypothetical protein